LELRRDLLDEGVVRKARNNKKLEQRMGCLADKGLEEREVKQPRVKLRGVPAIVPSLRPVRQTHPSGRCP